MKPIVYAAAVSVMLGGGSEIGGIAIEEARTKVRNETAMWAKVVKSTGIKVE